MQTSNPLLTIIIPILNESRTIRTILDRLKALPLTLQIIIVDDGSTDTTPDILSALHDPDITTLTHTHNQGKGAAIRTAIPYVKGDYTVIQDGDLEYDPQDFLKMLDVIREKKARVVYGSRILSRSRMSYLRYWLGGRGVTFFTNLLFGSHITDEPTCYKMFESELLKSLNLQSTGFEFCPEVTAIILKLGIPILEVPISYSPRSIEDGKKIRWKDGFIALWTLTRIRFASDQHQFLKTCNSSEGNSEKICS